MRWTSPRYILELTFEQDCFSPVVIHSFFAGGVEGLFNILADVAVREPLFDRLKAAQLLDDLDIEAVWPIYQQIVSR